MAFQSSTKSDDTSNQFSGILTPVRTLKKKSPYTGMDPYDESGDRYSTFKRRKIQLFQQERDDDDDDVYTTSEDAATTASSSVTITEESVVTLPEGKHPNQQPFYDEKTIKSLTLNQTSTTTLINEFNAEKFCNSVKNDLQDNLRASLLALQTYDNLDPVERINFITEASKKYHNFYSDMYNENQSEYYKGKGDFLLNAMNIYLKQKGTELMHHHNSNRGTRGGPNILQHLNQKIKQKMRINFDNSYKRSSNSSAGGDTSSRRRQYQQVDKKCKVPAWKVVVPKEVEVETSSFTDTASEDEINISNSFSLLSEGNHTEQFDDSIFTSSDAIASDAAMFDFMDFDLDIFPQIAI